MKKITKNQSLMLSIVLMLSLTMQSSCSYAFKGVKGDGNVVKQQRDVSSFSGIEVGGAFHVFLAQGTTEKLEVEADENLLGIIKTEVKGGTLHITTTKDIRDSEALNIYLTFKEIHEMEVSGACKLTGEDKFTFTDLEMDCSGASSIDLKLSANKLEMDCSGASNIELYGSAQKVEMDVSGASHFDAYELEVENYEIEVSGAAGAKIFVTGELSAKVSGAAHLKYKGDARITHHDVSGAGSMKKY
ncbi:MAG: DUF2807 domain-containing protein [Chlorobi bacterium]|nr:DUF2807 domain-containing protein [Chlorobiota bacterium]